MKKLIGLIGLTAALTAPLAWAAEQADQVIIDSKSEQVLVKACHYLRSANSYAVDIAIDYDDVLLDGTRVTYHRDDELVMARPDRLRLEATDNQGVREVFINRDGVVIYRPNREVYARFDQPGTLQERITQAENRGMSFPLADILNEHPCQDLVANMTEAAHAGQHYLAGELLEHIIVKTERVDVQLWVEADDSPLIRKVVISYRELEGQPQYQARLDNWDINPILDDALFVFTPPEGAKMIPFLRSELAMGGE